MAQIEPLKALRYDIAKTGGLQPVVAPPYDVIDAADRQNQLKASAYNVVEIDLPEAPGGEDKYEHARDTLNAWRDQGVIVQDDSPAIWPLQQDYTGPDGVRRTRTGFLAKVRIEDYGAGKIRPHERTHPGPKEDRLRLTRATRANLSPIFTLYSDASGQARAALDSATRQAPYAQTTDPDGTENRLWRTTEPETIKALQEATKQAEMLIADGHHRYETARVYASEIGGEGEHNYVLMCLVALEDPGLTVFPTHRLVNKLTANQHEELASAIKQDFDIDKLQDTAKLAPPESSEIQIGYIDSHFKQPYMLTLKSADPVNDALPGRSEPYRHLDTAVLEALIIKGALQLTDDDIDHLDGLGYARDFNNALTQIETGAYDAAFFMAPTPVKRVQEVAESGESMPPKSTYFFPKVPTGLIFNPLT
jgi:uncharacterized protein (DUF1015 family)